MKRILLLIVSISVMSFTLITKIDFQTKEQKRDLYLMYSDVHQLFKIGISNNPIRRLKEVNRTISGEVIMIKYYPRMAELEKPLHKRFKDRRVKFNDLKKTRVTEWFCLTDRMLMELDSIVVNASINNSFCYTNSCK